MPSDLVTLLRHRHEIAPLRQKKVSPFSGDDAPGNSSEVHSMRPAKSHSSFSRGKAKSHIDDFFSHSTPFEEEESAMDQLAKLEKRMKLGPVRGCFRSLNCFLINAVMTLIVISLLISVIWFIVFLTTLTRLGNEIRENTFTQLRSVVDTELSKMRASVTGLSNSLHGVNETTTPPNVLRDIASEAHQDFAKEFGRIGVSLYTANMRRAHVFINYGEANDPTAVSGLSEYYNASGTIISQSHTKNLTTQEIVYDPPTILTRTSFLRPSSFRNHVLRMGWGKHLLFTSPGPTSCENGVCTNTILKTWSHIVDHNGVRTSVVLSTNTNAFSILLGTVTRDDATSFILSPDRRLVAVSGGSQRIAEDEEKWRLYHYNGPASTLLTATEYPLDIVKDATLAIQRAHGDDLDLMPLGRHSITAGGHRIDFEKIDLGNSRKKYESSPSYSIFTAEHYMDSMIVVHCIGIFAFTQNSIYTGIVAIVATVLFALFAFIAVIVVACFINRPVKRLIGQMESVRNMNLDISVDRFAHFTELRKLQSMFYFLVLSLRETRAFLPAHVLQMLETRRLNHKKGKKLSEQILQTVDDELHSDGSTSTHSHNRSNRGSSLNTAGRLNTQFSLGMYRRNISVVHIKILNLQKIVNSTSPMDFVLQHAQLVELVSKLVNVTRSATMTNFSQDTLLITLNATISSVEHERKAVKMAMLLKLRINQLNERLSLHALEPFKIVISVCSGDGIVGTLGTHTQKQRVIFGDSVQITDIFVAAMEEHYEKYAEMSSNNVTVVVNQTVMNKMPKKAVIARVLDVLAMRKRDSDKKKNWELHYMFDVQEMELENKKEEEWMYEARSEEQHEEIQERNHILTKAWTLIVGESANMVVELLDSETQQDDAARNIRRHLHSLAQCLASNYNNSLLEFCERGLTASMAKSTGEYSWMSMLSQEVSSG